MPVRDTLWVDTLLATTLAPGVGTLGISLMTGQSVIGQRNWTLLRTIFDIQLYSITVAGAWGVVNVDLGFGVTSQEAFAADVLPDPNVNGDLPTRGWIYRTRCVVAQNGVGSQIIYPCKDDMRAKRKLYNGEAYVALVNTARAGTSFTVVIDGIVRQLWLMP